LAAAAISVIKGRDERWHVERVIRKSNKVKEYLELKKLIGSKKIAQQPWKYLIAVPGSSRG
jgi:hypothetical protein